MASDGTVKVAVRVRPLNKREKGMKSKSIVTMQAKQTTLSNPKNELDVKNFTYDYSYNSQDNKTDDYATQGQIFTDLGEDVIQSAFDGYNACVFAYGQTGAGKSYSMMGGRDDVGLVPRICSALFDRTVKDGEEGTKYSAEVSYLEIYNEKVKDLLNVPITVAPNSPGKKRASPSKSTPRKGKGGAKAKSGPSPRRKAGAAASLRVRENPQSGPYVEGLSVHKVTSADEINGLMEIGNAARTVAATNMNDTSSRSHALFTIKFTQASFVAGIPAEKSSKLNLVDLAGSERTSSTGATGLRLKEGGSINKSLTTLGIVINELAKRTSKASHIPYRDSVLTWLLRESLGGNSKTIMLAAISPADCNYGETLSTLHYANRAKNIVNKPIVNEDENVRIIKELRKEVEELKKMLGGASTGSAELDAKIKQSEALVTELTDEFAARWNVTKKVLEDKALTLESEGVSVSLESDKPHLVNLNLHDSLASGVTLHYLRDPITTIGRGVPGRVDVVLAGADSAEKHCSITIDSPTSVTLTPEDGVCVVNGAKVRSSIALKQGMQLKFGQQNMFRFNHPVQAKELRELRARGEYPEDDDPLPPPPMVTSRVSPLSHDGGDGGGAMGGGGSDAAAAAVDVFSADKETLMFKLVELEAQREAQLTREAKEAVEKAARDSRLKELESIVRRQSLESEEAVAAAAEQRALQAMGGRLTRSNSLVRRPDGSALGLLRAGSQDHLVDADLAEAVACTLETLDVQLMSIVVGYLDLDALTNLRVVSKAMQMNVDNFAFCKTAWMGWDALLEMNDAESWEFRLEYMPIGNLDRDFVRKTFRSVCKAGSTVIARQVARAFKITHDDVMHEDAGPFRDACRYGHQPLALWLADDFELNRNAAAARDNYCIGTACQYGNIEVVNWLCDVRFGLDIADIRADDNFALRYAALEGRTEVIKFLLDRFPFTRSDINTDHYFAVRVACQKGFIDAARILVQHFRLGPEELRSLGNYALYNACELGHVDIVEWLLYDVGLERADVLDTGNAKRSPFLGACIRGELEVAVMLADYAEMTTADVRVRQSEVFRQCCENGLQDVCEWLADAFTLTIDDVRQVEYYAVRFAHKNGYKDLMHWLISHFQLSPDDAVALRPYLIG